MTTLNLGCGNRLIKGAVNHDLYKHRDEVDVTWDLNKTPWPWADNEFDAISAVSVFEHLKIDLITTLNECWRILKPEGKLNLKFPLHTSPTIHDDPTHRWAWSLKVLDFVVPTTRYGKHYPYYTDKKWKIIVRKLDKRRRNCYAALQPIGKDKE